MATETLNEGATAPNPLRLDHGHNQNWSPNAGPVAILNEASTVHERIAYCWGLSMEMLELAELLGDSSDDSVVRVASLFSNHLRPLVSMLSNFGDGTRPINPKE